ncbi:MAG: hypothetical protein J6C22_14435 [Bacteroides sp.]|nr:hypothetical protein [Bacteroides sp.]
MPEEKIIEKSVELFLGKAVDKIKEHKEKKDWNSLFVDTGEFLLKQADKGELLIEDISTVLSSDNMKMLAQKTDEGSRYLLRNSLHKELQRLMLQYEIPALEAKGYITHFMSIILHELERTNPVVFQCAFLGDWRETEEKELQKIREEITIVNTQLRQMQSKRIEVYSLDRMELDLVKQTVNPSLNLDFFEIDDKEFIKVFEEYIDDECIYVSGQCKEETIYCLLNELRRLNTGKVVFVVKSEEEWKNLMLANEENPELGGKILIPWFCSDQICAIQNNTNIFVYGAEEHCAGKEVIKIRKRKRSTIRRKLEDMGMEYQRAYAMVEDTHGLYIPLKKKLIRGQYNVVPNWVNGEESLVIPLLLCGQWTETDGDRLVLEDLCGRSYEQIVEEIKPYMVGEDPLFISFRVHGRVIYHLASVENAWDYLDDKVVIGDKRWEKYVDCILTILSEPDPVFNFPEEQQHFAELLPGGKPFWSSVLKKGLLRSFIMKAYYKKNVASQNAIDIIVERILREIKSQDQWFSIANFFPAFCEASPKAVIRRLDMEWGNDTGLLGVFLKGEESGIFSKNYYTHYIWGIEQFLLQKEYAAWAVRWFLKMHNVGIKYAISNSPKETLKKIFCTWMNVTVLSQEDKIYLLKEAFEAHFDIWELIYDELPGRNRTMSGLPNKPMYRMVEEPLRATRNDRQLANKEYLILCLAHMEFNAERWINVIEIAEHFDKQYLSLVFEKLEYELSYMTDSEIISIKNAIRKEIYRHRYFSNSEWAMGEEKLSLYEEKLGNIKTENPVYEYEYLFQREFDFPLLHPCPYSEDEKREINKKLKEIEIQEGFLKFKEQGLDIEELLSICCNHDYSTLGYYLFDIYCGKVFDEDLFKRLLSNEHYKNIMTDYVRKAYRVNCDNLNKAMQIAKAQNVTDELLISLLLIEELDAEKTPLISIENEEIKSKYWKHRHRNNYQENLKTCRFIITEMCKYSDQMNLLDTLEGCSKFFTPEELLEILEKMQELEIGTVSSLSDYCLKSILKVLQYEYRNTEYCGRVAHIELIYRGLLAWEDMTCLKKCLENSPRLYAEMIFIACKKDEDVVLEEKYDESMIKNVWSLLDKTEFCPAESDGKVVGEALDNWIISFKEMLEQQKQSSLFTYFLGRLFAFSPVGEDGYYPCEAVRAAIQKYGDESLEREYACTIFNQRGMFSPTGGVAERELANKYKKNADVVRTKYPKVASIYDRLCENYLYDADSERECEEYAGI